MKIQPEKPSNKKLYIVKVQTLEKIRRKASKTTLKKNAINSTRKIPVKNASISTSTEQIRQQISLKTTRSVGQLKQTFSYPAGKYGVCDRQICTGKKKQHGVDSHFGTGQSGYVGGTLGNVGLDLGKDVDDE